MFSVGHVSARSVRRTLGKRDPAGLLTKLDLTGFYQASISKCFCDRVVSVREASLHDGMMGHDT